MILAAGRGERLRPLTDRIPKPLIPIAGEPLIVHQMRWLARAGITDIVVNLHHLGGQIEAAVGSGRDIGVQVRYSRETERLETGGGVRYALPLLGESPFLILNGDIWTDLDFTTLAPLAGGDRCRLVLTPTPAHREHGDFDQRDGRLLRNDHRPYVYCGIAILDPALFDDAPAGAFSMRELYFRAAAEGRASAQVFTGRWFDIGSQEMLKAVRRITD